MANNQHKKLYQIDSFARRFYCQHARINQIRSDKKQAKRKVRRENKCMVGYIKNPSHYDIEERIEANEK